MGDKVELITKKIVTDQLFDKLDKKLRSFFQIIENKEIFVKLQLPQSIKIHNVFHFNFVPKFLIKLFVKSDR